VLAVVAWNMVEKHGFLTLLRASRGDAAVLLATFLVTVLRGLTEGILIGFGIGALLFLHRMAQAVEIDSDRPLVAEDKPDTLADRPRTPYDSALASDPDVVVCRISGAFVFGAAASVATALDRLAESPKAYVVDFSAVPVIDSTAATTIAGFVRKSHRAGAAVYIAGAEPPIRRALLTHGVRPPGVRYRSTLAEAVAAARARIAGSERDPELTRRSAGAAGLSPGSP
jgi:SulP family sulfate permease